MSVESYLPYARQSVTADDIAAVVEVLESDWLTTGPMVDRFEAAVAGYVGCQHAVAVASGTAALHAAISAAGITAGDEVILPPLTFVATANAILYQGGTPVFTDISAADLLLDPLQVEKKITPKTKMILAVDYAGQPCDYVTLRDIAKRHDLLLLADASHSLGATQQQRPVGQLARLSTFSFHPVKPLTTAEGGMVVTDDADLADQMRTFRNHGITNDHRQRQELNAWQYQMTALGFNYRLSDLQCALGLSQLQKLSGWIERRRQLAQLYHAQLQRLPQVKFPHQSPDSQSGWHLFVIRVAGRLRDDLFQYLRRVNIGVNVHYGLVYRHPYYQQHFNVPPGTCPNAELAEAELLSLPLFPAMQDTDVTRVCDAIKAFFA